MSTKVTPWWEVLRLRREVIAGAGSIDDVQMSLFRAVYGIGGEKAPYADAAYYGEITHPTPNLVDLMAKVIVRLGGGARYTAAPALWQLDQAMGGGKSHGLIGVWHVAAHPVEIRGTDVGKEAFALAERIVGEALSQDLRRPQVVVLACDNMTAGKGNADIDGPARTLHERFLWHLFGGDYNLFRRYQEHHADKSKLAEALTAVGRPVLILVDEILDYVRQLSESQHADLAIREMAFLRALLDTVNDVPNVVMAVVQIASERDPMHLDTEAQRRREEIEALLVRNGKPTTVTSPTDFAAILRRRLFEAAPPAEVLRATTAKFLEAMKGPWVEKVFTGAKSIAEFTDEVERCYPFHPTLMGLAEQEWATRAGFQKVRSTIQIFAATAYALLQRGRGEEWAPLLIGPGDLPLSATEVREAIIGSGLITDARIQAVNALAS
jgi:predicted AAA+ superfamily ATPase